MKSTGIVRRIDELGRIVLPMELRKNLDINIHDAMEIYIDKNAVILRKYAPACIFCGESNNITRYKDKNICKKCFKELKSQAE